MSAGLQIHDFTKPAEGKRQKRQQAFVVTVNKALTNCPQNRKEDQSPAIGPRIRYGPAQAFPHGFPVPTGGRALPALQVRVEQALRELPLAEADVAAVAKKLAGKLAHIRSNHLWNTAFFDIRGKVTAVCDDFAGEGLSFRDFLDAARRRPQLFIKSPATVIANITESSMGKDTSYCWTCG